MTFLEVEDIEKLSRSIAFHAVRKGCIESIHKGTWPHTEAGDYSDVRVITPAGEISWNQLSRISQDEMQEFMKAVVNRLYTMLNPLLNLEEGNQGFEKLVAHGVRSTQQWNKAEFDQGLIDAMVVAAMDPDEMKSYFESRSSDGEG